MQERGYSATSILDGRTRESLTPGVKAFQEGDDPLAWISLKAGGVGFESDRRRLRDHP